MWVDVLVYCLWREARDSKKAIYFCFLKLKVSCFYMEVSKLAWTVWEVTLKDLWIYVIPSGRITNSSHQFWLWDFFFFFKHGSGDHSQVFITPLQLYYWFSNLSSFILLCFLTISKKLIRKPHVFEIGIKEGNISSSEKRDRQALGHGPCLYKPYDKEHSIYSTFCYRNMSSCIN